MANLQTHPLVKAAYDVCQLIEACGCSEELTRAVIAASALLDPIEALALECDHAKRYEERWPALKAEADGLQVALTAAKQETFDKVTAVRAALDAALQAIEQAYREGFEDGGYAAPMDQPKWTADAGWLKSEARALAQPPAGASEIRLKAGGPA